jgi:hypothetical protein
MFIKKIIIMQTCVVRLRQSIALKLLIVILVITFNCHSWITDLYILLNLKHCVVWLTKYVSIQLLNFHQIFVFF